jgi:hypothetical protein
MISATIITQEIGAHRPPVTGSNPAAATERLFNTLHTMNSSRIFYIKLIHTVIFLFMVACLVYILYCCVTRTFDLVLLFAIGIILVEGIVLLINQGRCPFTILAEKYGAVNGAVTDLFLPDWLARNTFKIFTTFFVCELLVLGFRYLSGM